MTAAVTSVLLVDDQPANLKVLLEILKKQDFQVYLADSGERALATLVNIEPDLILLDVMMPGLNGFETCEKIKANKQWADIPVIFITALEDMENKLQGFHVGGVDYITKPFQHVEVMARIKVHVALRQKERELADARQRLSDIVEFLPDPTSALDLEGNVIIWNRAAAEYTGVGADEMLGKGNYEHAIPFYGKRRPTLANLILDPDSKFAREYNHLSERDGNLLAEEVFCPAIGKTGAYISAVASKLYDAQGSVRGAIQTTRDITVQKELEQEREELILELQTALKEVKTLSGLLPICAHCKKVRDDEGYWNQIESYLQKHTGARFSHGICSECAKKLYGDQDWFYKIDDSKR